MMEECFEDGHEFVALCTAPAGLQCEFTRGNVEAGDKSASFRLHQHCGVREESLRRSLSSENVSLFSFNILKC